MLESNRHDMQKKKRSRPKEGKLYAFSSMHRNAAHHLSLPSNGAFHSSLDEKAIRRSLYVNHARHSLHRLSTMAEARATAEMRKMERIGPQTKVPAQLPANRPRMAPVRRQFPSSSTSKTASAVSTPSSEISSPSGSGHKVAWV